MDPAYFHEQQQKDAYFIKNLNYKPAKKVDALRVSQSISKNMLKDAEKGYGKDGEQTDINLKKD